MGHSKPNRVNWSKIIRSRILGVITVADPFFIALSSIQFSVLPDTLLGECGINACRPLAEVYVTPKFVRRSSSRSRGSSMSRIRNISKPQQAFPSCPIPFSFFSLFLLETRHSSAASPPSPRRLYISACSFFLPLMNVPVCSAVKVYIAQRGRKK